MSNDQLLTMRQAAEYLRLPLHYLRHQCKHRTGPQYISPSPRAKFFAKEALDAWRATWSNDGGNGHRTEKVWTTSTSTLNAPQPNS